MSALGPRPRLVLFDLDGTLVDSAPDIAAAVNVLMARHGLAAHPLGAVRSMIGHGIERLVERAFAARGVPLDPVGLSRRHAEMMAIYPDHLTRLTTMRSGAHGAVAAARLAGLPVGVVTNKPEAFSRAILDHFGLSAHVDVVVGGDSGFDRKPAPQMLLAACDAVQRPAADAVMVGDSAADLAAAQAAGIRCVLLRHGYSDVAVDGLGADAVIDELDALPTLLGLAAVAA